MLYLIAPHTVAMAWAMGEPDIDEVGPYKDFMFTAFAYTLPGGIEVSHCVAFSGN